MSDTNLDISSNQEQLATYKVQFDQIEQALKQDPDNESLLKLKADLIDVINLTEDLLKLNKHPNKEIKEKNSVKEMFTPSTPPSKSASSVPFSPSFSNGTRCLAKYDEDGLWYEAVIESVPISPEDKYLVSFTDYGNQAYVGSDSITSLKNDGKKRKEKYPADDVDSSNVFIPKSLKILPTDSEEVRQSKKKRMHVIKSQSRLKKLEEDRQGKKNAWQEFTTKASKTKTAGPALKKDSIFKSPDTVDGKVGVTGSGKPLTPSPQFKATEVAHVKFKLGQP